VAEVQKHGVLPVMLSLIRLCHDGMTAVVRALLQTLALEMGKDKDVSWLQFHLTSTLL